MVWLTAAANWRPGLECVKERYGHSLRVILSFTLYAIQCLLGLGVGSGRNRMQLCNSLGLRAKPARKAVTRYNVQYTQTDGVCKSLKGL
jgi:hypothetical protein